LWRRRASAGEDGLSTAQAAVLAHLRGYFAGHRVDVRDPPDARVRERIAMHDSEHGLEFVLIAPDAAPRHALLVTIAAHYHANPDDAGFRLDLGHTVPIGEPWSPGSSCDHLLVSLPYPFGRELEVCAWEGGHARLLWLLPITTAERDFKAANGLDALEQRFEDAALEYWDTRRASVV
jgi:Suppressor of fused protein (SUFU)